MPSVSRLGPRRQGFEARLVIVLCLLGFISLGQSGCQPALPELALSTAKKTERAELTRVTRIFFGTNRADDNGQPGSNCGELQIGACEVRVPVAEDGRLPRDNAGLPTMASPARDAKPLPRQTLNGMEFFSAVSDELEQAGRAEALIIVPPGMIGFDEAANRAASIAVELDFRGAVFLFSWPAKQEILDYESDERNVAASTTEFARFLEAVTLDGEARTLHILSQGLGARLTLSALEHLAAGPFGAEKARFQNVILVAPDVPTSQAKSKRMTSILDMCQTLTIYASKQDRDLKTVERIRTCPRLGDSLKHAICTSDSRCFAIDASTWDTSFGGAPRYGAVGSVIDDVRLLLDGADPFTRGLCGHENGGGWILGDFNRCLGGRLRPSQSTQSAARIRLMRR